MRGTTNKCHHRGLLSCLALYLFLTFVVYRMKYRIKEKALAEENQEHRKHTWSERRLATTSERVIINTEPTTAPSPAPESDKPPVPKPKPDLKNFGKLYELFKKIDARNKQNLANPNNVFPDLPTTPKPEKRPPHPPPEVAPQLEETARLLFSQHFNRMTKKRRELIRETLAVRDFLDPAPCLTDYSNFTTNRTECIFEHHHTMERANDYCQGHTDLPKETRDQTECVCMPDWFERYSNKFTQSVIQGRKVMSALKVIFVLLIRDAAETLASNLALVEDAGAGFKEFKVLLVENDSKDDTKEKMKSFCDKPHYLCHSENLGFTEIARDYGGLAAKRFVILSLVRNKALGAIKNETNGALKGYDHALFLDWDITDHNEKQAPHFERDGLSSVFAKPGIDTFDVICANGVFRYPREDPRVVRMKDSLPLVSYEPEFRHVLRGNQYPHRIDAFRHFEDGVGLIPMKSCFGGFAIYNLTTLMDSGCNYDPERHICEHLVLHECLNLKGYGGIYLAPQLVVFYTGYNSTCRYFQKPDLVGSGAPGTKFHNEAIT